MSFELSFKQVQFGILILPNKMGCTACIQMCGNQKDSPTKNSEFLLIAQQKAMFLRKTFAKPQQKKFLNEYFSDDELEIILHLMSLQQVLRPQNILLPQAGELHYLSATRRTLWKLYSFDILVYEYTKNSIIPPFTQDFSTIKLTEKTQQRFYQIGLDINRTFPVIKHLNREHLSLVLKNLTLYFDGVGYTQGMNFVVGFMLLCGFAPKQAYWLFIHLSFNQNFLLVRNFTEGFKNVLFTIKVFEEVMEKQTELSKIKEKVDEMGLTSFFYSFSWFLCYFLYSLDPKSCVLIWDFILTFDSRKLSARNIKLQKHTAKEITQKTQLQSQLQRKHQTSPEYFQIIHSQRGSILNTIYLAFQLIKYLSDQIHESDSAQQLLKILRNQNLVETITPQLISSMIESIRKGQTIEQNLQIVLDWKYFVDRMKNQDKELYQIQTSQNGMFRAQKVRFELQDYQVKGNQNLAKKLVLKNLVKKHIQQIVSGHDFHMDFFRYKILMNFFVLQLIQTFLLNNVALRQKLQILILISVNNKLIFQFTQAYFMQPKLFERRTNPEIQLIALSQRNNFYLSPVKHSQKILNTYDNELQTLNIIPEEPITQKNKKKKKSKKKSGFTKQLKQSESEPVLLQWVQKENDKYDFHLPSIKTLHSSSHKKLDSSPVKPKKFTLPRLDYSSSEATKKLVQKFESGKSERLQRDKFMNMLELFESKLVDVSERSRSVRSEIQKKQKIPKIRVVLNHVQN